MTPLRVFRAVAVAEAITWAGLLVGMWFKHASHAPLHGEVGVQVFGPIHGVAFIAFCLVTVLVAVDQQWSRGRLLLGLASAIPPFCTVAFDRYAERRGLLDDHWHMSPETSQTTAQRVVCWLVRHRRPGIAVFVGAVGALTTVALVAGPPGA